MPMFYDDIRLITRAEPVLVRARIISATLSDGTGIRVRVFRRDFEWNFTHVASGGKLAGYPDYNQTKAIRKFTAFIGTISPAKLDAAVAALHAEYAPLAP
ncbi:hypothetical protein ACM25O_13215 [Sulfitobacter pontiacus]